MIKIKLGSNTSSMPDPIDWNIGDIDCSTAKYFYHGSFLGFKYQNDIVWYKQKNSKKIEKIAFLPSGDGIILYSDGKNKKKWLLIGKNPLK